MNNKKILFITENNFVGKVPRNYLNMRTEYSWMHSLDAYHVPLFGTWNLDKEDNYDLGIIIIPKKIEKMNKELDWISLFRKYCKKVAIMQEGPGDFFHTYSIENQFFYYNLLLDSDFLLCHNSTDVPYYKGLTGKNTYPLQSLMITDNIKPREKETKVMIGGTFCSWYSGFDSYIVAREFSCPIFAPSMGRKQAQEDYISGLTYLPYMIWADWIYILSEFKYAVHLMRTYAAGTFSLNCAFLSIPCIGYNSIDTQNILHTRLSVDEGDIEAAKYLAVKLRDDKEFYEYQSRKCKENYNLFYSEEIFLRKFDEILMSENV